MYVCRTAVESKERYVHKQWGELELFSYVLQDLNDLIPNKKNI